MNENKTAKTPADGEPVVGTKTRVGEMEWQWGFERGWDAAMNQKRKWVGLTDEEFKHFSFNAPWEVVQEIEAKLKEKNT